MRASEPITVREFEYLVPQEMAASNCHYLAGFKELRDFVLDNLSGESPLELMRLCSRPGAGEAIQACNYVGMVEMRDGTQVEILPKIGFGAAKDDRRVFLEMLAQLGADATFRPFNASHVSAERMPLFEAFVRMFLDETADLVRVGLRSAYSTVRSEERFVRGKIDVVREMRKSPAHAERVNLVFDEFGLDRPENRLVKTCLIYLRRVSRDGENVRMATRLLGAFDEVSVSHNVDADLARCVSDRSTRRYSTLVSWCRVFLKRQSFSMFRGSNVAMALLFPMEKVFEDYVGHTLQRTARGSLRRVELQAHGQWLFENHRGRLRPDILCELKSGERVVLDTKWKRVSSPRDIATSDLYQMYAYGKRYAERVVLVYPWHEGAPCAGLAPSWRHVSPDGVQVDVFFVDLRRGRKSLEELLGLIA
ncbi:MAG: McrC family protein [Atopobiaceae bacterium]|nr:McrC family protein [Atopobiaceae bacterium]